jgi:type IV secretory pathway VirJ component
MATQAAQDIFTGAVLIGYHSRLTLKLPLCKPDKDDPAQRIPLATRLARVQFVDALEHGNSMPQLEASYAHVAALRPPAIHPPASLADLPVVEVPAESNSDLFAVFVSGDGGWAGIDKSVAASLAARGIPVVGIDSLRYFWSERTPAGLASDLGRVLSYYSARWNKQRALLIGFSQGADVLPFAVNRLAPGPQRMVTLAVFMSLSSNADFEFHLSNWISSGNGGRSVLPEVARLHDPPGLCIYGADDEDTICPRIHNPAVKVLELEGGHHFDGEYDKVADLILKAADEADAPRNPRS